jgi:murein DD-endopeptidase MepM/ murein hydrolase activator NlpD
MRPFRPQTCASPARRVAAVSVLVGLGATVMGAGVVGMGGVATPDPVLTAQPLLVGPATKDGSDLKIAALAPSKPALDSVSALADKLSPKEKPAASTDLANGLIDVPFSPETPVVPAKPEIEERTLKVQKGDILASILADAGLERSDIYNAIRALKPHFNPSSMREGQEMTLTFKNPVAEAFAAAELEAEAGPQPKLVSMSIRTGFDEAVRIDRADDGGFHGSKQEFEFATRHARASGVITSSLYMAAKDLGVPDAVVAQLLKMYAYDIDFQREIRVGDQFEVFYTYLADDRGQYVKTADVLFGSMTTSGRTRKLFRFTPSDTGVPDYFDEKGHSAKKFLMKTPIDGGRLSSGFGMRRHPILGYTKMHRGTDFAAPTGTKIYAAGDGVVELAGRKGGYGKYVRIRHANGYKTAYAHMSRYGRNIKNGARVRQGQVIGYVGTTGRSTGPHLHYEVHHHGKHVNPMRLRVPTGRKLEGAVLTAFREAHTELETKMAQTPFLDQVKTAELDGAEARAQ